MLTVLGLMTVCILVGMQSRALLSHGKVLLEFGQAAECEKDPPVSVYVSLWVRCDYSVTDLCGICYLDEMITAMRFFSGLLLFGLLTLWAAYLVIHSYEIIRLHRSLLNVTLDSLNMYVRYLDADNNLPAIRVTVNNTNGSQNYTLNTSFGRSVTASDRSHSNFTHLGSTNLMTVKMTKSQSNKSSVVYLECGISACQTSINAKPEYSVTYEKPRKFLPNYRNPCWRDRKSVIKCLPYFYLAGFPKCGSSDLYSRIFLHPGTARNEWKENYWMFTGRFKNFKTNSLDHYATVYFKTATLKIVNTVKNGYHPLITGDGTPSTIWQHEHWRAIPGNECCTEPRLITAQYVMHVYPRSKFIVILRDPTERLISDYFFFPHPQSMISFEREVDRVITMYEDCFKNRSLRSCFYDVTLIRMSRLIHLIPALYYIPIADWLKVFPREQFLFIPFQDYTKHMAKELAGIYSFLGLDRLSGDEMQKITNKTVTNRGKTKRIVPTRTIDLIRNFYRVFNKKLASLLADERFLWS